MQHSKYFWNIGGKNKTFSQHAYWETPSLAQMLSKFYTTSRDIAHVAAWQVKFSLFIFWGLSRLFANQLSLGATDLIRRFSKQNGITQDQDLGLV